MQRLFYCIALWAMTTTLLFAQKKPNILLFEGKKQLDKGEKNILTWKVKNAPVIYLQNNLTGEKLQVQKEGTHGFIVEKDFSFTLIAENGTQQTKATFTGKVLKRIPIIHTFGGSESYYAGSNVLPFLHWRVSRAKYVFVDNSKAFLEMDSTIKINLDSTHTFRLVAVNEEGDTARAYHRIRLNTGTAKFGISDGTGAKGLVAGIDNNIIWEFAGASWVMIAQRGDTLPYKGSLSINPDTTEREFIYDFIVKYPNSISPTTYSYRDWISNSKIVFKTSTVRSLPNKEVKLDWNTRGLKDVKLIIGGEMIPNQPFAGSYKFKFYRDIVVTIEGTDLFGKTVFRSWTIRNIQRPFIRNTISYNEIKNDAKKRRIMIDIFEVNRDEFPKEVKMKLLVADSLGNFISGLAPPDLSLMEARRIFMEIIETGENGKSDYINNFKVREVTEKINTPYDIALCLDYSGSMQPYRAALESATAALLNSKDDADRFSVVRFTSDLFIDSDLKQSSEDLVQKWTKRKSIAYTGTALYAGADIALNTFDTTSSNQKVLFLLTDGQENSSFAHAGSGFAYNVQQIAEKARKMGVKIYPIGLGPGVNDKLLQDLAWLTDGKLLLGYEDKDIQGIYGELSKTFKNYYEITYTPKNRSEGKKTVFLKYNDNRKEIVAEAKFYLGDKFKIFENTGFVSAKNTKVGKQPLVNKQAVAFFDVNKDNLQPTFTASLDAIVTLLKQNPKATAEILGHTDLTGNDERNFDLSKRRAETVQAYLVSKGIDKARTTVKPLGAKEPIWAKEKEAWQAQENRRIEIILWE